MILVYITCKDRDEARRIGRMVVERRLAACADLFPIESFYWWQGQVVEDSEHVVLAKTRPECYTALAEAIKDVHSYEVPAIIRLPVAEADSAYVDWLRTETQPC